MHCQDQTGAPLDQTPAEEQGLEDSGLHAGEPNVAVVGISSGRQEKTHAVSRLVGSSR